MVLSGTLEFVNEILKGKRKKCIGQGNRKCSVVLASFFIPVISSSHFFCKPVPLVLVTSKNTVRSQIILKSL